MVEAQKLCFSYRSDSPLIQNVSFRLEQGEIGVILGRNGTGKTTLLKCLMEILPAASGNLCIGGSVGYVPQQTTVMFSYTVLDMVVMGRARHISVFSPPRKKDYNAARSILDKMDLSDFSQRPFTELSGGERQLILIARALASECSVLILDEPTSALDFKNQNKVLQTLRRLSREENITVLLTSHSPNQAIHTADKALLMFAPGQYTFGRADINLSDESLSRLYGMNIKNITYHLDSERRRAIVPVFG